MPDPAGGPWSARRVIPSRLDRGSKVGYRVFISHSAPDAEVVAGICATLQEVGVVLYVYELIPPRASGGGLSSKATDERGGLRGR